MCLLERTSDWHKQKTSKEWVNGLNVDCRGAFCDVISQRRWALVWRLRLTRQGEHHWWAISFSLPRKRRAAKHCCTWECLRIQTIQLTELSIVTLYCVLKLKPFETRFSKLSKSTPIRQNYKADSASSASNHSRLCLHWAWWSQARSFSISEGLFHEGSMRTTLNDRHGGFIERRIS